MFLLLPSPRPFPEYIDDEAPEDLEILEALDKPSRRSTTLQPAVRLAKTQPLEAGNQSRAPQINIGI